MLIVYRPPSNSFEDNLQLVSFISNFCVNKEVIILGDFNLPSIDWRNGDALYLDYDPLTSLFTNCFNTSGLHQWVDFPTFVPSGNILDLVITTEDDRIGNVHSLCPFPGCGHVPIIFNYHFLLNPGPSNRGHSERKAWFRGNYAQINEFLLDIDWDYEFQYLSTNSRMERLLEILRPLISQNVPLYVPPKSPRSIANPPNALKREREVKLEISIRLLGHFLDEIHLNPYNPWLILML